MNGPGNGNGDDLPEPVIEPIRNFADLPEPVKNEITNGALLTLRGGGPHANAINVNVLSGVLVHFDRLFRILQAAKSGLEVKRTGRVAEVVGARHLSAFPAFAGSYALPLRLEAPEGQLVGGDREALESLMRLLAEDETPLQERLGNLPERVGDELYALLHELALGEADLAVEAVRNGEGSGEVEISAGVAKSRATWLTTLVESDVASETIVGKLFRIDTKRGRIAVDSHEEDESVIVEANFQPAQLEALRRALNHEVEIDVQVIEERRPYEQTARNRVMSIVDIRQLDSDENQVEIVEEAGISVRGEEADESASAPEVEEA
ncbi:MAG TPA: hypothetical protein VNN15_02750 [Solirubrobacterales bacterium]|nr:hypothetical protein [Solirubrobacterales bacterium]